MDDEIDPRDAWLDIRLKAAARDAEAAPRRRLLLPSAAPARDRRAWLRNHRLLVALVVLNAATGAAVVALGVALTSRGGQTSPGVTSPPKGASAGAVAGRVTLDVPQGSDPTTPPGFAVVFGSLWIADAASGNVVRVDAATLQTVATIPVDTASGPMALATDGSTLWATAAGRRAVVRIDPASSRVADTIPLDAPPRALAVSGGTLWVAKVAATDAPATLTEVDTGQRRALRSFPIGRRPDAVVVSPDAVWVDNAGDGTLSRLDLSLSAVATTRPNPNDYDYGYVGVAVDASGAWAVDQNRSVLEHVDGATLVAGRATGVGVATGAVATGGGPLGVAIDGGSAWVVTPASLVRVDLATAAVRTLEGSGGLADVVADGTVWVISGDRTSTTIVKITPAA